MIKAIVLDVGGVLLRTEDYSGRQYIERKYHLPPGGSEKLVFHSRAAQDSSVGIKEDQAIWDYVAQKLSLSRKELDDFIHHFWMGDRLDQNVLTFIQKLRPQYITALLSNAWKNFREVLSRDFDVVEGKTVDHILISSELGVAKPDPEIYYILVNKLKCDFKNILFVDDFAENIESAKKLGIHTIHYHKEMDLINEIKLKLS